MPRGGPDACILCEQIKCRCGKPERSMPTRRKKTPAAPAALLPQGPHQPVQQVPSGPDPWEDAPPVKEAARAAMKARAARSQAAQPARVSGHDATLAAIKALLPILHPDDRAKYQSLVNEHSEVSIRAATWRTRRAM